MKKTLNLLLMTLLVTSLITSCKNDNNNNDDDNDDNQNTPPTAGFTVNPSVGETGTVFSFDASISSDAEQPSEELEVRWDWQNDGTYDTEYTTTKTATHQYNTGGLFTIKLEVKDNGDLTATATGEIEVTTEPGELNFVTGSASEITETTATMTGMINSLGEEQITDHGHCYSFYINPDLKTNGNFTSLGSISATGEFVSSLTGLIEGVSFYVKAYVITTQDTIYGEEVSFDAATSPNVTPCTGIPTVTDADGNVYNTVEIDGKCWMRENLKVGIMISNNDQSDNGIIEKYCYDNFEENCDVYGALYQWNELMQYVSNENNRGICPEGWHIPTFEELSAVKNSAEFNSNLTSIGQYESADNTSGFSALLSGYSTIFDNFTQFQEATQFWSTKKHPAGNASIILNVQMAGAPAMEQSNHSNALSVRCVKDN